MKNEKVKPGSKETINVKQVADKDAAQKKKKKSKQLDETPAASQKVIKTKPEKGDKKASEPKVQKAQKEQKEQKAQKAQKALKEDKPTKFLVSMKKSVRKSVKKEAAEAGVSMNEYIVLAVKEKLGLD